MQRWAHTLLMTAAIVLAAARSASAVHLEKLDEQVEKQVSPQAATDASDPCFAEASANLSTDVNGTQFTIDAREHTAVRATTDTCDLTAMVSATITVSVMVAADSEPTGTPVELCVAHNEALFARATGGAMSEVQLGGNPVTDPETLVRSPGNIVLESIGPFDLVNNGQEVRNQRTTVTALVGDTLTIVEMLNTMSQDKDAVGTASADATTHFSVTVGACTAQGAPAASPGGLVVLAAVLAGMGIVVLQRRQSSQQR